MPDRSRGDDVLGLQGKRVLVSVHPFGSHLRPMLATLAELRLLGAEVYVACAPKLRGLVEGAGLGWVECGAAWPAPDLMAKLAAVAARDNAAWMRLLLDEAARRAEPDSLRLAWVADRIGPDLWIYDRTHLGSYLAGGGFEGPRVGWDVGLEALMRGDGATWTRLARLGVRDPHGHPVLTPTPPGLLYPGLADQLVGVQHEEHRTALECLPLWMQDLPTDNPLVYVSLGSLIPHGRLADLTVPIYRRVITALTSLPCTAVVAAGAAWRELSALGTDRVRVVGSVPGALMLSVADLFVTHCGYSSLREALARRVPMVTLPLTTDQPQHAARLADLGLAVNITDWQATVETIRARIALGLMSREEMRARLAPWQLASKTLPRAADEIGKLITTGKGGR